ncbi:DUF1043 domain-containing protein [Marinomonas sp. GJ51-6]|uniref:DUF1043 domain-containing protein n=1 Tax=Marinomonas sp. GJ51-6 TaxID=2992802 RepID=UPI0029345151|nr:DUF1043 domain-containing protein [Marinomonas sp. GJ51-6]WOD07100.1 DUF1043 domain-containing protein [Marinomonas sp. GJ51-6]
MNLEEFNIIIFITGIILGSVITLAIKNFTAKNTKKASSSDLVTIRSLQQELESKQVIIDNFFMDSNEKLNFIEKHMASLRSTFAENAKQISSVIIDPKSGTENGEINQPEATDAVAPPRDYALKKDKEPGMLSEEFGLNDKDTDYEPKRAI